MTSDFQNPDSGHHSAATEKNEAPKLPVRGLAMILIAVAVLLAVWALWSMNSGNSEDSALSTSSSTEVDTPSATVSSSVASDTSVSTTTPASDQPSASQAAPAAVEGTEPVRTLYVLNNSTVPQLAARVADELRGDFPAVESGNLPDALLQQNTVYFTPGNPDAEQAARQLADRVGGIAEEKSDVLPKETEGTDALVLVLVQDTAL